LTTTTRSKADTRADYALLVMLAAIFGASFILTNISVRELPPATIVASRVGIAALILYTAARLAGQNLPGFGPIWWPITLTALTGTALPFFLITWGQQRVDAGLAAILMATMPLITLVLAHFFTSDEKLNVFKVIGFCLGLAGVAVLIGVDKLANLGDETIRQYALMGAAVCYAVNALLTKQLVGQPRRATAAALMIVGFVMIVPFSLLLEAPWQLRPSSNALAAVLVLAIVPTALGTLMIFAIVKRQGAAFLSQINFLVPVFGVLWAVLLLSERLPANAIAALALILAGVAIARIRFKTSSKPRSLS